MIAGHNVTPQHLASTRDISHVKEDTHLSFCDLFLEYYRFNLIVNYSATGNHQQWISVVIYS